MQQRCSILKSPERIMFSQRREGLANARVQATRFQADIWEQVKSYISSSLQGSLLCPSRRGERAEDWSLTHIVYHQSHTPHTFSTSVFHPLFPTPAYQSNSAPQSDRSHPFCWLHGYDGAVVESTHLHTPAHTHRGLVLIFYGPNNAGFAYMLNSNF